MAALDGAGIEIIRACIGNGGTADERVLEAAGVGRYGTGRVLDALAALVDGGYVVRDGAAFRATERARDALWNAGDPVWARVLRLLRARSCTAQEIARVLMIGEDDARREAESLRESGQAMLTTQRRGGKVEAVYEIQSEGVSRISRRDAAEAADRMGRELGRDEPDIPRLRRLLEDIRASL
ncbi:MAG: hypothetical protein MPJ06_04785 [Nitrosopumilus sp.]|nr:hypothetical protein [Nitrosopumilus sp.]MDA7943309.1 hypothetical protein [Nitrosopumilus sp.]MDA7998292.1 hypothetical protein [Nitrosopumilus sp.]MDA7998603.1 hypothetical protein [Nitrosopumilus sp.]